MSPHSKESSEEQPDAKADGTQASDVEAAPPEGRMLASMGLSRWWAVLPIVLGSALTLVFMSSERPLPGGLVFGAFGCVLAAVGWLWLATPKSDSSRVFEPIPARALLRPTLLLGASLAAHLASVVLAVAGVLPLHRVSAAVLVTGTFLWLLFASFEFWLTLGAEPTNDARRRSVWRRHGFWLLVLTSILYLPMLGNFALLDPWETHYGEVAREMLARDDWVSLWWAQDGWFFTKPILNFWIQGLSFKLFGVEFMPDRMILSSLEGLVPQPEWACRLPVFWMTLAASAALYKACAFMLGPRIAFISGMVLSTCPYWFLLARQTMADMPYVAPMCVALALQLIAFHVDPEARVRKYALRFGARTLSFDAFHLLFFAILLFVLPQVLYLSSLNVTLHLGDPFGFRPHLDEFQRGSGGGNCGLPGNKSCRPVDPRYEFGQPVLWGLVWLTTAIGLLFWNRKERRTQRLLFLGSWVATALSVMAKGAPGFVLPLVTAIGYPLVIGRFRDLLRMKLPSLLLLTACVAFPWYVQMFMRHGMPFFERLVLHDMVNRAFAHVHDTNSGDDTSFRYYIWQLGYGLFPWTGLAAGGLVWWARGSERENSQRTRAVSFLLLWFLAAFGMFTLTLTKFHHYILPLVPPVAVLTGMLLAAYLPRGLFIKPRRAALYLGLVLIAVEALLFGVLCFYPDWKSWFLSSASQSEPQPFLGLASLLLGIGALVLAVRFAPPRIASRFDGQRSRDAALSVVAVAAAIAIALSGRDMVVTNDGDVEGQIRLLHLVTYNYDRPWPEVLNLRGPLAAFTAVATLSCLGLMVVRFRRHAAVLFSVVGFLWAGYVCNEYLVRIAPHWAQRENMLAYYENRSSKDELLVAYQMNWKGENFYTGNRMATFVSSGAKFKRWLKRERQRGTTTMFFTTEHSRIKTLKKELGTVEEFTELTTKADDNKFFVAKVVFPKWTGAEDEEPDDDSEDEDE